MKRILNRMLRYADAIVKRGVDKLIDVIAHSAEPQTKNTVTPQRKKSMRNDTDCAQQTTGHTTNCGLTEQAISLMNELYDIRYNVLDRTPEVQRRDQADKGFVPVSKLVRNTMVIDLHKRGCMVWNNDVDRIVESAYMPQYHPFSAYLQSLPQWDGTDRVGPTGRTGEHRRAVAPGVRALAALHGGRLGAGHNRRCKHQRQCHDTAVGERGAGCAQKYVLPHVAASRIAQLLH